MLASLSEKNKFKLIQSEGKQTIVTEFNAPRFVSVFNQMNKNGKSDGLTVFSNENYDPENGFLWLSGQNIYPDESLVIEGSETSHCQAHLRRMMGQCKGFLQVRELTAADQPKKKTKAVPEDSEQYPDMVTNPEGDRKRIGELLKELLPLLENKI